MNIQEILSKLSVREKAVLCVSGDQLCTAALPDRGIPRLVMTDGTTGVRILKTPPTPPEKAQFRTAINASFDSPEALAVTEEATCFPAGSSLACSWDPSLAEEIGAAVAAECRALGAGVLFGPGLNTRRSPLDGRGFEYYSEDPVLSAAMATAECEGIYEYNLYPFIKHFALNDQEINRNGMLCTWTTEQAMREIYLKPFERCIKESGSNPITVMSSYNYIGTTWAGANPELLNTVLRDEWGFRGMVLTDYFGNYGYMDADKAVRGGSDIMLATAGNDAIMTDTTSATSVLAMRQACKNIMYTMVNSYTYETYDPNAISGWVRTFYIVDAIGIVALVAAEAALILSFRKKQQEA